jgi:hypothetical protein
MSDSPLEHLWPLAQSKRGQLRLPAIVAETHNDQVILLRGMAVPVAVSPLFLKVQNPLAIGPPGPSPASSQSEG